MFRSLDIAGLAVIAAIGLGAPADVHRSEGAVTDTASNAAVLRIGPEAQHFQTGPIGPNAYDAVPQKRSYNRALQAH
jgi:hypothetical protein